MHHYLFISMTATPSGRTFSFVREGADEVKARAQIEVLCRRFVTTEIKLDATRIIQENFSHSLQPRAIGHLVICLPFLHRTCPPLAKPSFNFKLPLDFICSWKSTTTILIVNLLKFIAKNLDNIKKKKNSLKHITNFKNGFVQFCFL